MRSRIFMVLFALPFFSIGVWMVWSIGSTFHDAWSMRAWAAVPARVLEGGYETRSGDDSDTYEAYARYAYRYDGRNYEGSRVGLSTGADNLGDYQVDTGRMLGSAAAGNRTITVFVDPAAPERSVIDRTVRWGLVGFKSIFVLLFGGFGLGLLIYAIRGAGGARAAPVATPDKPWLAKPEWQSAEIRSSSRVAMFVAWGFAAVWNLISAPLPFAIHEEVLQKHNYPALIGLLFPFIGVGLIIWALRRTLEWRRFGAVPLSMDPYPGAIGGHVGGSLELPLTCDASTPFQVTLTNLHSYVSGSGKNRSRREQAKWQDRQVAHVEGTGTGTRISFRFDVPDDLPASDASPAGEAYYLWRLNVSADLEGIDIDRDYEIPVYPTGERTRRLSEVSLEQARVAQARLDAEAIRGLVRSSFDAAGRALLYPAGRNVGPGGGAALFGSVFFAAGWFLFTRESEAFIGGAFLFVGGVILLSGLYQVANSLRVYQAGDRLLTERRVLGIVVRRQAMRKSDISGFLKKSSMQSQAGGKHTMYYKVLAVGRDGRQMVVGEGFRGAGQADSAIRFVAREFGITAGAEPVSGAAEAGRNFLAQDA